MALPSARKRRFIPRVGRCGELGSHWFSTQTSLCPEPRTGAVDRHDATALCGFWLSAEVLQGGVLRESAGRRGAKPLASLLVVVELRDPAE